MASVDGVVVAGLVAAVVVHAVYVFGVAFGRLVSVVPVHATAAVAVHGEHRHHESDPQPVRCEELGHDDSLLLGR